MKYCPECRTKYPNHRTICTTDGCGELLIASHDLEPGTLVKGKFRIKKLLGKGTFGAVYLADHLVEGEPCALKFLFAAWADNPDFLNRFRNEARAAKKLHHPNVVPVFDLDLSEDGLPFIAMEYVQGRELRDELAAGWFPVERALTLARGVALGLGEAHAKKMVHRDVKPENILIAHPGTPEETPKLLDFGIVAMQDTLGTRKRTQGPLYTAEYAAPEQLMGMSAEEMDGRVDLYAFGGVLYEMLTGRTCFHARNTEGWIYQHLHGERVPPSALRPELKDWLGLDELVVRMLAVNREHRPRNIAEFLRDLDLVQDRVPMPRAETQWENRRTTVADPKIASMGKLRPSTPTAGTDHAAPGGLRWWMVAVCVAAVVAVAVVAVLYISSRESEGTTANAPGGGTVQTNSRDGLLYAWIPPGSFTMGCSAGDAECQPQENPAHTVSISKGFWIGQTPVTVMAWKRYRAATNASALPSRDSLGRTNLNEAGSDEMPVVSESWAQAESYCRWAGMQLPTEAEWEHAARAGAEGSRYGDLDAIAWYGNNSGSRPIDAADLLSSLSGNIDAYQQRLKNNGNFVHAVAQKQPNGWHLHDMLGDVFEWTSDWYNANAYRMEPATDPRGAESGATKTIRGGSWDDLASTLRFSERSGLDPKAHQTGVGFRCAGQL